MENLSRSDGRTPSHLMSGVVRLLLSYDMFMLPAEADGLRPSCMHRMRLPGSFAKACCLLKNLCKVYEQIAYTSHACIACCRQESLHEQAPCLILNPLCIVS
jgi:hypothetical protein